MTTELSNELFNLVEGLPSSCRGVSREMFKRTRLLEEEVPNPVTHKSWDTGSAWLTNTIPGGTPTTTPNGVYTILNDPTQGPGFYQRTGMRIRMKKLSLKWYLVPTPQASATSGVNPCVRVMVVYEKQTTGNNITFSTVCRDWGIVSSSGACDFMSWPDPTQSDRFEILYDQFSNVSGVATTGLISSTQGAMNCMPMGGAAGMGTNMVVNQFDLDLGDRVTVFKTITGTGNSAADFASGILWHIVLCNFSTQNYTYVGNARLHYEDE